MLTFVCMRDTGVIHELPLCCTFLNCAAKPMWKTLEARFASPFSGSDVTRSTPQACMPSVVCMPLLIAYAFEGKHGQKT